MQTRIQNITVPPLLTPLAHGSSIYSTDYGLEGALAMPYSIRTIVLRIGRDDPQLQLTLSEFS